MKKTLIWLLVIVGLFIVFMKGIEWWLEQNFEATINNNPERSYNITYSDFDLDSFFRGVTLDNVSIDPINKTEGSLIVGRVDYATIKGLVWIDLLFSKELELDEIDFKNPKFDITLSADSTKKASGKGMQNLFGDILSRANVKRFSIENGAVEIKEKSTGRIKASLKSLNVKAKEISTEKLLWKYIIPFELGDLQVTIDSVDIHLNDYTNLSLAHFSYDLKQKEIIFKDVSLGYEIDWVKVSQHVGIQNDIIEFKVKELAIHNLLPSSEFFSSLEIDAQKVSIDSLDIKLSRNKNLNRPHDTKKKLFNGMIEDIPVALILDSIQITNSKISYSELGVKKHQSGTVKLSEINGLITNITNVSKKKEEWKHLTAKINSKIADATGLKVELTVPYHNESFALNVDMGSMNMKALNPTLKPLAGIEIESGHIQRLYYSMNAGSTVSKDKLVFDYKDLHLELITEDTDRKIKKATLMSLIANGAIRPNNIPTESNYLTAEYQSERNIYRSPIHYIIQGMIKGFTRIVPSRGVQRLINKDSKAERKEARKEKKEQKKHKSS